MHRLRGGARKGRGKRKARRGGRRLLRRLRIRLNRAQGWIYARTDGRVGGRIGRFEVLLLTTVGRRTGRARRTPVQCQEIDGDLVIVAAAGGSPAPPAWWLNIQADPHVGVQRRERHWRAIAVAAQGADRAALWGRLSERNPYLERIERRAGRELPLIRLVPDPAPGDPDASRAARAGA